MASAVITSINTNVTNLATAVGNALKSSKGDLSTEATTRAKAISDEASNRATAISSEASEREKEISDNLSSAQTKLSTAKDLCLAAVAKARTELEGKVTDLQNKTNKAFHFVGSCAYSALPTTADEGAVYNIKDDNSEYDGMNYVYVKDAEGNGHWDSLGQVFDFSTSIDDYSSKFSAKLTA